MLDKDLFTTKELWEYLNTRPVKFQHCPTQETLRKWAREGKIPVFKRSGRGAAILFKKTDIINWNKNGRPVQIQK